MTGINVYILRKKPNKYCYLLIKINCIIKYHSLSICDESSQMCRVIVQCWRYYLVVLCLVEATKHENGIFTNVSFRLCQFASVTSQKLHNFTLRQKLVGTQKFDYHLIAEKSVIKFSSKYFVKI